MTAMQLHRIESNRRALEHVAHNLRLLAEECPDARTELERSVRYLERAHEALNEVMQGQPAAR